MSRTLESAERSLGRTSPLPAAAALIVQQGTVIAEAHASAGQSAEILALRKAGPDARGSTLYLPIEPCRQHGRTGCQAILEAGVERLVVAVEDPHERGESLRWLRQQGIEVASGVLSDESLRLNPGYWKYSRTGLPHVVLTLSATLDGKIATTTGASQWISGEESRRFVHRLRDRLDAVVVGSGTAIADDPRLTCRIPGGRDPLRVIVDTRFRISPDLRVFQQRSTARTVVLTANDNPSKRRQIEAAGHEVILLPAEDGRMDWRRGLRALARRGIRSVLIEGGATVAASILRAKMVDELLLFYAPMMFGSDGIDMMGPLSVREVEDAVRFGELGLERVGKDLIVRARAICEDGILKMGSALDG